MFPSHDREGLSTIYQVSLPVDQLRVESQSIEERIKEVFFVDLFKTISNMKGIQPRNQLELTQRNQESLLLLGPALERIQREFLSKVIERTFKQAEDAGLIPEPPEELQEGAGIDIKFISAVAQAQRSVDIANIESYTNFVGFVKDIDPAVVAKYNGDQAVEEYALLTGVSPSLNRDQEQVEEQRRQERELQEQALQLQAGEVQASTNAKNAAAVKSAAEAQNVGS